MEAVADVCQQLFGIAPGAMLLVCLLVFLAGYVDAIAGGGGLISLPAYMIAGLPTHAAIATNKMSSTMGTTIATWHYAKSGYIQWKLAGVCVVLAVAGSTIGSNLVLITSDAFLRVFLLAVLPITAIYVMRSKSFGKQDKEPLSPKRTAALCVLVAFCVGIYDGFYGPGTGTFLMLLLTGVAHLKLKSAAGITKAINLTTNVTALVVFLLHGQVLLVLGLVAITIVVLTIFFAKVIWDFIA